MEEEIVQILQGEYFDPEDIKSGAGGGRYYFFELGIRGVGKKKGRHWSTSVEAEVAAYKIDRLYGFNLVPVTISREAENGFVSMQFFYEDAVVGRRSKIKARETDQQKMKIFDYLIDNFDRRDVNFLVTEEGQLVAIDHGVSLHNARSVQFSPPAPKLNELDLTFFKTTEGSIVLERLRSVSDEELRSELSSILSGPTIDKLIERKKLILDAVM